MPANSWDLAHLFSHFRSHFSSSFLGLSSELQVRSRERDGCMGGKLDLV
jgi:hypothetical protein